MVHGNEHTMHTIKSRTQQIIIFLHWIFRRFLNDNQITHVLISWQVCDDILVQDNAWQSFPGIKMSLWVTRRQRGVSFAHGHFHSIFVTSPHVVYSHSLPPSNSKHFWGSWVTFSKSPCHGLAALHWISSSLFHQVHCNTACPQFQSLLFPPKIICWIFYTP